YGNETVLDSCPTGSTDGGYPQAPLVMDKAGNLYGTTGLGGCPGGGGGVVFKVDTAGIETVLHRFTNTPDGANPLAGLIMDKSGNLYGTTATTLFGGTFTSGIVFKLDDSGKETVLHIFTNTPDGAYPVAGLVIDKRGNVYSTIVSGRLYQN